MLSIKRSGAYFKFLHTPQVKNVEKIEYKVNNLEELFVFLQEFKKVIRKLKVRYYEVYVSAYEPFHQGLFRSEGFIPRGYIPSWKYNPENEKFEDYVLFNCYEGEIDENIQLIPEGKELFKILSLKH